MTSSEKKTEGPTSFSARDECRGSPFPSAGVPVVDLVVGVFDLDDRPSTSTPIEMAMPAMLMMLIVTPM